MTEKAKPWDILSREEREFYLEKSNWRGAYELLFNWASILAMFTVLAMYPNPFTIFVAWILLQIVVLPMFGIQT